MNFVTFQFIAFLLCAVMGFVLLEAKYRKYFLLFCSYFFYATWSIPLIGIILFSTSSDYFLGRKISAAQSKRAKKILLTLSIVINCSILGFFKYFNFFLSSAHSLWALFGYTVHVPTALHIILPLGISFYTFEAISYVCDVYRGEKPATSWLNYNFYIMYFPHLISGPIIRYRELSPQCESAMSLPDPTRIKEGFRLMLAGFIFKLVIADNVASVVDPLFNNYHNLTPIQSWLASLAFTVQIYFDFLGYTHIARGVSLFFNIELPINFNHPYNAKNISEFWQRWNMTLSRWIRDYLYIPLGGNRGTLFRTATNLGLTMFIAGLWHGASWTFAIWGLYQGVLLAIYHVYRSVFKERLSEFPGKNIRSALSVLLTFTCVVAGWVVFRSATFDQAFAVLGKMFNFSGLAHEFLAHHRNAYYSSAVMSIAGLLFVCFIGPLAKALEEKILSSLQLFWLKELVYSFGILLVLVFMFAPTKPFIYFVF